MITPFAAKQENRFLQSKNVSLVKSQTTVLGAHGSLKLCLFREARE